MQKLEPKIVSLKARLHIGEATRRFLFVSLCRVQRFARVSVSLFPCPKIVGFWPAGFARVSSSQALCGLISAKSWALLAASK